MNTVSPGTVLVVVPTYQELESLPGVLARVRRSVPDAHVLVVDDDSPDGTGALADDLAAHDDQIHVLHRAAKEGLGAAYRAGFGWGVFRRYDVLVEMDADGSHQPEQLPRLLSALSGADLVLGSRWVPGGAVHHWPLRRRLLSRGGNLYARLALGLGIHDATGGFRVFRRTTLQHLDWENTTSQGYCFQVDLAHRAVTSGLRVVEVPIDFVEREAGSSKMSGAVVRESLLKIGVWGVRHRSSQLRALAYRRTALRRVPAVRRS